MRLVKNLANMGFTTIKQFKCQQPVIRSILNKNIVKPRLLSTAMDYDHEHYWLKKMEDNKYAFGIKSAFEEDYSAPQMIFLECDIGDVLQEGDEFGIIENEKAAIPLEAPFDNAKLLELDEDVDFDIVMESPEEIENKLAVFEDVTDS